MYIRVKKDGTGCVMPIEELREFIEAEFCESEDGDGAELIVERAFISDDEYADLEEFAGF